AWRDSRRCVAACGTSWLPRPSAMPSGFLTHSCSACGKRGANGASMSIPARMRAPYSAEMHRSPTRREKFRCAHPSRGGHAGVTLLELLIVLTLIGLIAALTIPSVSGVSTTELKSAARELASGLRLARTQAIVQRTEATLEVDVGARAFR